MVLVLPSDTSNALAAVEPEVSSPCDISPCSNGGRCLVSTRDPTQYICSCVEDFGGSNCEKSKNLLILVIFSIISSMYLFEDIS